MNEVLYPTIKTKKTKFEKELDFFRKENEYKPFVIDRSNRFWVNLFLIF